MKKSTFRLFTTNIIIDRLMIFTIGTMFIVLVLFFTGVINFQSDNYTRQVCNNGFKEIADSCFEFDWTDEDAKKITFHKKNISGNWEKKDTYSYMFESEATKSKDEMMDKISINQ